mgnify:CR=1 FL=1
MKSDVSIRELQTLLDELIKHENKAKEESLNRVTDIRYRDIPDEVKFGDRQFENGKADGLHVAIMCLKYTLGMDLTKE